MDPIINAAPRYATAQIVARLSQKGLGLTEYVWQSCAVLHSLALGGDPQAVGFLNQRRNQRLGHVNICAKMTG